MTLVASVTGNGFLCVSDILLLADGEFPLRSVSLPVSGLLQGGIGKITPVATTQKAILLSPSEMVMWAGREVVARSVKAPSSGEV